jgi:membrane protein
MTMSEMHVNTNAKDPPDTDRAFVQKDEKGSTRTWHSPIHRLAICLIVAGKRFWKDDCIDRAALLAYATLLAIIPLAAVIFWLLDSFGFGGLDRLHLLQYVAQTFLPKTGNTIVRDIDTLADRGAQLGVFGILGLVVTAMLLLNFVERNLNAIWRTRPLCRWCRFLRYLVLLVVGPLALAFIALLWIPIQPEFARTVPISTLSPWVIFVLGYFVESVIITLVFHWLPATQVWWREAIVGAMSASVLIEVSKLGFYLYLRFSTFQDIYGALGVFPVFLLWIYFVWSSLLYGAEVAALCGERRRELTLGR